MPADTQATTETRALLGNMHRLTATGVLFGHHDDTAYGINWRGLNDNSDVKKLTGSYPAVYGWDLSGIEQDSTHDIIGTPFKRIAELARQAYERGGVNTFSWHMSNPGTGKNSWDTSSVQFNQLLPGGSHHQIFLTYLDRAARFLSELKGRNGEPIPVLLRPYHELIGNWFWWGRQNGSNEQFVALWRFTVDYLRNTKQLHNLLLVYSVNNVYSELDVLNRYPGDAYVDIIGFDSYCTDSIATYKEDLNRQTEILDSVAADHQKLSCIAETGYQGIPLANWWTDFLMPALSGHQTLSYVLIWRNHGPEHFFVPYPGQISEPDFNRFYQNPVTIFQNRLTPMAIYGHQHYLNYNQNSGH